jgi:hypothetical protein
VAFVTEDDRAPAAYAADIDAARVRLFAQIAIQHADNHRTDIETALAAQGLRRGRP